MPTGMEQSVVSRTHVVRSVPGNWVPAGARKLLTVERDCPYTKTISKLEWTTISWPLVSEKPDTWRVPSGNSRKPRRQEGGENEMLRWQICPQAVRDDPSDFENHIPMQILCMTEI